MIHKLVVSRSSYNHLLNALTSLKSLYDDDGQAEIQNVIDDIQKFSILKHNATDSVSLSLTDTSLSSVLWYFSEALRGVLWKDETAIQFDKELDVKYKEYMASKNKKITGILAEKPV